MCLRWLYTIQKTEVFKGIGDLYHGCTFDLNLDKQKSYENNAIVKNSQK